MVTVVTGPPCSGKTHYIQQRAKPGDVVIDLDIIAASLTVGLDDTHYYPPHVRHIARRARRAAIDAALPIGTHLNVWIVDSAPSKEMRAFYRRNRAAIVDLNVTLRDFEQRVAQRSPEAQAAARALVGQTRRSEVGG